MKSKKSENGLIGIIAICGFVMFMITTMVLSMASSAAWVLVPIAICLTVIACFMGILELKIIKITGGKDDSTTIES